ncbi:MAG: exodeoxyribonuclease VII large subunit [Planctomyces sp.]|nr:exodeoxyribonuclease VII large subunit [Planctomyces sp.]
MSAAELPKLTVSQLSDCLREIVELSFPRLIVTGEISGLTRASSGHLYFTLKDDASQIKAVMWRSAAQKMRFDLKDGLAVEAIGGVEVYAPRGQYQLMVERLVPQGVGPLELAFRQLQAKLAEEGLFDPARKRPLPQFPKRIALITSPAGAALHDMLQILLRRWPGVRVIVIPVPVQGPEAAPKIAAALKMVHRLPDVDVVVCGRGGGSLEDLWAFNEEVVARAIANCKIPVISAVGHETDVTIADLVADQRALTPSEAAERVVPVKAEWRQHVEQLKQRMALSLSGRVAQSRRELERLAKRRAFAKPLEPIHRLSRKLDELEIRLKQGWKRRFERSQAELASLGRELQALSPLAVLERGFSITKKVPTGELIKSVSQLAVGDRLATLIPDGQILSQVLEIDTGEEGDSTE